MSIPSKFRQRKWADIYDDISPAYLSMICFYTYEFAASK